MLFDYDADGTYESTIYPLATVSATKGTNDVTFNINAAAGQEIILDAIKETGVYIKARATTQITILYLRRIRRHSPADRISRETKRNQRNSLLRRQKLGRPVGAQPCTL
jgi:hypothetical protein